jgi:hypothetical protein
VKHGAKTSGLRRKSSAGVVNCKNNGVSKGRRAKVQDEEVKVGKVEEEPMELIYKIRQCPKPICQWEDWGKNEHFLSTCLCQTTAKCSVDSHKSPKR